LRDRKVHIDTVFSSWFAVSLVSSEAATWRGLKTLVVISLLVNALLAVGFYATYFQSAQLRDQVQTLTDQNRDLNSQLLTLKQALEIEREQLSYYKNQAEYYSRVSKQGAVGKSLTGYARMSLVAVRTVGSEFSVSYEGVILDSEVELRKGEGRALINTEPKIGIDMQTSLRTAVSVAEAVTGVSLNATDVVLTIRSDREVEIVDGPSAGAAVTVALIAAVQNRTLNPGVYITGTINPDGSIGKIGGVMEKALAVSKQGAQVFLIPLGESVIQGYRPVKTEPIPGFTIVTYEPYEINVQEALSKTGSPTKVIEVANIHDALDLLTSS